MEISGHCAVCGNEASRGCLMCEDPDAVYCCAEHQFSHWISRHKDECTYDTAGLDISEVIQQKRTDLRARASHLCKDEFIGDDVAGKQALCYSLAALRSSMRRSHKYTQLQLRDCVLLASVMKHLGDREASAYFWQQCADVISREPYGEWARNKVVYEYAADECEEMGEPDAAVSVLTSHMHHIERTFGKQQLDAAECAMRICQVHVSTGSYDAAIESWTHAVSIRERHSSRSDVKERLIDNYRFGSILHTLAGQHEQAVDAGMRGRDLARAGNIDKGMAASGFSLLVGSSLVSLGRLPEALGYFEEAYRTRCAVLGEAHEESIVARKRMNGVRKALGYELIPGPGMKSKDKGQTGETGDNSASGGAGGDGEGGEASPSAGGGRQDSKAQPGASLTDLLAAAAAANRASGKTSREAAGEASGSTPGPSSTSLPMLSVPRPKAGPGSRQVDSRFGDGGPSSKRLKTGESSPQSPGGGEDEDGGYPSEGGQPVTPPPAPPLSRPSRQPLSLGPAANSRGMGMGGTGAAGGGGSAGAGRASGQGSGAGAGPGRAPASSQAGDGDDMGGYADDAGENAYDDAAELGGDGGEGEGGPDLDDFDGLDPDMDMDMGMDLGDGDIDDLDMGMGAGPTTTGRGTRAGGGGGGAGGGMGMGPAGQGMAGSGPGGSGAAGRGVSSSYPGPQGSGGPSIGGAMGSGPQTPGGMGRAPRPAGSGARLGVSSEGQDGSFESMGGGIESEYGLDTGGFDTMAASPSASPVPMGMDGMGEEELGFDGDMGMGQPGGTFSSPAGDGGYGPSPWNSPMGGPGVVAGGAAAASLARAAAGLQFSSPAPRAGARVGMAADASAYGTDNGFNDVPEEVFEPGSALGMDRSTLAPIRAAGGGGSSLQTMGLGSPMVRPLQVSGERASLAAFFDPALVMGGGMVTAEDRQAASAGGMAGLGVEAGYGMEGDGMSYGPGGVMGQGQSLSDMDLSMTMEEGSMGMGGVGMAPAPAGKGGAYSAYSAGAAPPTTGQTPAVGMVRAQETSQGGATGQQQYTGPGTYTSGQGQGSGAANSGSYGDTPARDTGSNATQATIAQGSNAGARGVQEYGQSFTPPTAAAPPPASTNSRALPLPPGVRVTEDVRPVEGHAYRLVDVTGVGAVADVKVVPVGQKGKYYQDSELGLIDEALDKLNSKTVAGQTVHLRHVVTRQADKDRAREAAKRSTGEYLVGAASVLGKPIYDASEGSTPAPGGGPGMGTPMGSGQAQGAGMMMPSGMGGNQYNYTPGASANYTFAPGSAAIASQAGGARPGGPPPPAGLTSTFGNAEVYASYEHDGFAQAVPGSSYYGQQQGGGPYPESKQGDGDAAPATGRAALYSGMGLQAAAMSQAASNAAQSAAYAAAGAQRASAMAATGMASGYAPGAAPGIIRPSYGGMRSPGVRQGGGRTRIIQVEVEEDVLPVLTGGATAVGDGDDTSTVGTTDPQIADDGSVLSYGRPGGSAVHEPLFVDMQQAQAYAEAVRRETHVSVLSGGQAAGRAGRGRGNASALAGLVPKNYGLGLVAVDSSALGALGAGAEDGMPGVPSVQSPAEAALYLEAVTERLTRSLAALVTRADSIKTARRQGDGGLAVPAGSETALDGKEEEAKKLQQTLKQALEALATTSDKAKDDRQILEMRDVLFTVIAEVGKQVDAVLQGSNINMDALATLAAAPPGAQGPYGAAMVERAQRQRRQSSAGASVASGQSAGGGLMPTSTDEFSRKAAEMSAAMSAVRQNTLMSVAAVHMQEGAASGSLGGKAGLMAMIAQARANVAEQQGMSGLVQPGLIKAEPNTEGRRMKAVFLSGDEIMASLQSRLLTLGLFKSMGNARRQFRIGIRSFFLGVCVLAVKQKKAAILASKVQILGMMAMIRNERQAQLRSAKVRALGTFVHSLKIRDHGRRATKVLVLGVLAVAKRRMDAARRRTELFALGLFVTVHRTQGSPQGFKYGQKPTRKPTKAPRVRGIHWDTLGDVKGSVWERKSSTVMLRQLFPDLKAVFTEKEKEKKGGMTEEEAAAKAKEANKPKEISFLEAKDSKNMAIALSKFKSMEGFKDGKRFEVVKDALCKMDEAALGGTDGVSIFEKNLPTGEQLAQARDFGEDQVKFLGFAENYVWWMTKVPMLADRVKCMTLKVTFPENLALVEKDLRLFLAACAEVLDNPRLVEFLVDVVRPFGNELNRSSGKKDAQGIKIEGLKKLAATKTADNSMTSLYYIVSVLQQHRPSLLELCNDFKGCAAAAKLAMQSTETNLKQVVAQAKTLNDAMEKATASNDTVFIDNLGNFASEAAQKVKEAEEKMATLKGLIVRVAEFLGEKEKSEKLDPINKPEGLFAEWYGFIDLLTKTLHEYKMKEAQKEKKAKEEAAKAAAAAEKAAKAAAKAAAGGGEGGAAKSGRNTRARGGEKAGPAGDGGTPNGPSEAVSPGPPRP